MRLAVTRSELQRRGALMLVPSSDRQGELSDGVLASGDRTGCNPKALCVPWHDDRETACSPLPSMSLGLVPTEGRLVKFTVYKDAKSEFR